MTSTPIGDEAAAAAGLDPEEVNGANAADKAEVLEDDSISVEGLEGDQASTELDPNDPKTYSPEPGIVIAEPAGTGVVYPEDPAPGEVNLNDGSPEGVATQAEPPAPQDPAVDPREG